MDNAQKYQDFLLYHQMGGSKGSNVAKVIKKNISQLPAARLSIAKLILSKI